jgi:hypothetical protein
VTPESPSNKLGPTLLVARYIAPLIAESCLARKARLAGSAPPLRNDLGTIVDVFATRPLTGNQLSLVPDADGLDESQMRAIAREFNQSETTFLLRPTLAGATCRLRSFTPTGAEVSGAGHNALGAWIWLEASGRLAD